jgi:hypothetical protein
MLTKREVLRILTRAQTYLAIDDATPSIRKADSVFCCVCILFACEALDMKDKGDAICDSFCALYKDGIAWTYSFHFVYGDDPQTCRFMALEFAKRFIETEGLKAFLALYMEPWR